MENTKPKHLILSSDELKAKSEARNALISKFCDENATFGKYLRLVPLRYRFLFYKIFNGENSRVQAVKAKCIDCSNFQKEEVTNCAAIQCPLWNFRPYQKNK